jgi:hypothetical protein
MFCSQLRATAKPFLPALKMESCIVVRSLVSFEGEALVPVDPVSRQVGLSDIRQYFPAADGLHFIQQKGDGRQRLVSVCQSFSISEDKNGNICYGDKKFIPPSLGFSQIYYVTERGIQVEAEEMAEVENMVDQVEDILVDIKENLSCLSRVCDGLKALKFSPGYENIQQIPPAVLCQPKRSYDTESAFYHYSDSVQETNEDVTKNAFGSLKFSPRENMKGERLPVASDICEPKPKSRADSVVETENSKTKEAEAVPKNCSTTREIMMMVEGKEVNIISIRPKLIKKKC